MMVDMLFNHVCVCILQLRAWGGAGTPQGYVKDMKKYHSDGKSPLIFACQWGGCGIPTGFVKHMQSHHADGKSPALQNSVWMGRVWHMPRVHETSPSMQMVSLYTITLLHSSNAFVVNRGRSSSHSFLLANVVVMSCFDSPYGFFNQARMEPLLKMAERRHK